jgi:hypothetical protein
MRIKFLPLLLIGIFFSTYTDAQWTQMGAGANPLNANQEYIHTLCTDSSGHLYAAGRFTDAGGAEYVAKWNGTAWVAVGTGTAALAANGYINSICTDPAGNIYAGGDFKNSSNIFAYLAKWDGTSWSEVGPGQMMGAGYVQRIRAICSDTSGNIYAAGDITDNTAAKYIITKWDGTNWSVVGSTPLNGNATVNAICVDGNKVYVAGAFTNGANSGAGHPYVAVYNGTTWSELGAGAGALTANDVINSLCIDASHNVYAGGSFTDASVLHYVAKWNGTTWAKLGIQAGIGQSQDVGSIYTVTADAAGSIYTGGGMLNVGMKEYVAKWNGTRWSELGHLNADNFINAIATYGSKVYAAGSFRNDSLSPYIAQYIPTNGIGELSGTSCRMYPNPASSSFALYFSASVTASISITDIAGQEIKQIQMVNENQQNFAIGDLASGLYLVRIETNGGETHTLKLIKE